MKFEELSSSQKVLIEKFELKGIDKMNDQDVLEFLLISICPELDTKDLAKRLLAKFSTFSSVLNASITDLAKTKGVSLELAYFIHSLSGVSRRFHDNLNVKVKRVYDTEKAIKIMSPKFIGKKTECVVVLLLDSKSNVIMNEVISEGLVGQVPLYVKDILRLCIENDASTIFLAHNHPSGIANFSTGDIVATREIQLALLSIYVHLEDHIIFAGEDTCSLRESGLLEHIETKANNYRRGNICDVAIRSLEAGIEY